MNQEDCQNRHCQKSDIRIMKLHTLATLSIKANINLCQICYLLRLSSSSDVAVALSSASTPFVSVNRGAALPLADFVAASSFCCDSSPPLLLLATPGPGLENGGLSVAPEGPGCDVTTGLGGADTLAATLYCCIIWTAASRRV